MAKRTATSENADEIITMAEAARALNKSPQTVARWIQDGLLNAVRMPTGIFHLRKSELNKFLGGTALPTREIA